MIYSQSKHTNLFFLVPFKCGWSSFYTLNENGNLINAKKYYHDIEKQKVWVDVFLIRNPYQRIVSIFKDKFKQSILKQDFEQDIHKTIVEVFELDTYKQILDISFEQYLEKLSILIEKDPHFFPLNRFYQLCINTPKYIIDINNTSLIENLLGSELPHENSTSSIPNIILNDTHKEIIQNYYKQDFILFYNL